MAANKGKRSNVGKVRNVLFIMCDQLRADHLSCAGHPHLRRRHRRAGGRGVLFPRAYVQSGVCGPSRMRYYTGRYVFSHGATWNRVPLSLREHTIGDYLRPAGIGWRWPARPTCCPTSRGWSATASRAARRSTRCMRAGRFEEIDRYDGH